MSKHIQAFKHVPVAAFPLQTCAKLFQYSSGGLGGGHNFAILVFPLHTKLNFNESHMNKFLHVIKNCLATILKLLSVIFFFVVWASDDVWLLVRDSCVVKKAFPWQFGKINQFRLSKKKKKKEERTCIILVHPWGFPQKKTKPTILPLWCFREIRKTIKLVHSISH